VLEVRPPRRQRPTGLDAVAGRAWNAATVTEPDLKAEIAQEISIALERLDADEELLAIIGSWRDTLTTSRFSRCCATTARLGRPCIARSESPVQRQNVGIAEGDTPTPDTALTDPDRCSPRPSSPDLRFFVEMSSTRPTTSLNCRFHTLG